MGGQRDECIAVSPICWSAPHKNHTNIDLYIPKFPSHALVDVSTSSGLPKQRQVLMCVLRADERAVESTKTRTPSKAPHQHCIQTDSVHTYTHPFSPVYILLRTVSSVFCFADKPTCHHAN